MLKITFSNRTEQLQSALLERLRESPTSPFTSEEIVVASAAMRRHLELAITDRFGICANVQFSFLARWLWQQIAAVLPDQGDGQTDSAVLAWRIHAALSDASFIANFPRLDNYLATADAVMRFDLSTRIAGLFEQYGTYRPDWITHWSSGRLASIGSASGSASGSESGSDSVDSAQAADQRWQAALWQRVTLTDKGSGNRPMSAALLADLRAALQTVPLARRDNPIHLFGIPTIAPTHLAALRELASHRDINLYLFNPCQEYWFDVVDRARLSYLSLQGDTQHHEVGNQLLAAWGRQTQAQLDLLFETDATASVDDEAFVNNADDSLLAHLQNAVLQLTELRPGSIALDAEDRSIECHVCHSFTRELEVLQDQLLTLFAGSHPPVPSDIVILTPDLEQAAPLIDAVFGSVAKHRRIPYTITGRAATATNPVALALLELLTLAASRVTASAVLTLLHQPLIGARFHVTVNDLDLIRDWIDESGIRWGLDASHRAQCGLPADGACTFDDGMQRLFLGYALPARVDTPFAGLIPATSIEGSDPITLGRFWECMQLLSQLRQDLQTPRAAQEWHAFLTAVVDRFLIADRDHVEQFRQVQDALRELHEQLRRAEIDSLLASDVVQTALGALLDQSARGGVPTGSVTFSSMASLRGLPFPVICMIGMNDGAFPSTVRALEFDLMATAPRRGDRQRSADERNLFLDLILSARRQLYLSYCGRGIRDNAPLPPSVLVDDLLDYVVAAIATDANDNVALRTARARLVVDHPLQPFSQDYFTDPAHAGRDTRLVSSNDEYCAALQQALRMPPASGEALMESGTRADDDDVDPDADDDLVQDPMPAFFTSPLPAPAPRWHNVTLEQLKTCMDNPSRYLLTERLGLRLREEDETLRDEETFVPDAKETHNLARRLLPLFDRGLSLEQIRTVAVAGNDVAPGPIGAHALDRLLGELHSFVASRSALQTCLCLPAHRAAIPIDLDGQNWMLDGVFNDLRSTGLVRARFGNTRATDYLQAWIDHLLLNAALPDGVDGVTVGIFRDGQFRYRPCPEAADIFLQQIMRLYRDGLCRPLHFFPKSAWAYIRENRNLQAARKVWISSKNRPFGEDRDAAYRLALRGIADPLDAAFVHCAELILAPMRAYLEDERL